jgi:hypothetical protein
MNPKVSASDVTVCVEAHVRLGAQRVAEVDVLFVACLLLGEWLEQTSETLGQMGKRHETRQLAEDLLLRCGDSVDAVAPAERLRLEPFPTALARCH